MKNQGNGKGYLRRNTFKRAGSKDPEFSGHLTIAGVKCPLRGWRHGHLESADGYLTLRANLANVDRPTIASAATAARESRARPATVDRPTLASAAAAARESWPCPLCDGAGLTDCPLCNGSGAFNPARLCEARRVRTKRKLTSAEAARGLEMSATRFLEMERGNTLAPDSWGGAQRRRDVAAKLVIYLARLGMLEPEA